jgi:hypothetical protein
MDVSGKEAHVRSFIALKMEAVRTSETSANFNVTTRRYIPEDTKLQETHTSRVRANRDLQEHVNNITNIAY